MLSIQESTMRSKLAFICIILIVLVPLSTSAACPNPSFADRTITTAADGAYSVFAIDVDEDGDMDVLSASSSDNTVSWYDNDGSKTFTKKDITTSASQVVSVYAIDVDGDADVDVLSASLGDNTIAWYDNDGTETFTKKVITTTATGAVSVIAIDVDGDSDIDVLSATNVGDTITWYENDGSENFTTRDIVTDEDGAWSVFAIDLDGDGDIDVLSASLNDNRIAWYDNDGSENFTRKDISTSASVARSVYAIDMDGDGDIDVVSASSGNDTVAWYENDGNENFTPYTITSSADSAFSVYAIDVDGDTDIDVLSASSNDDTIAWYENNGSESFTQRVLSTTKDSARSVFAADIDGDGDVDILSASSFDDVVTWFEQSCNDVSRGSGRRVIKETLKRMRARRADIQSLPLDTPRIAETVLEYVLHFVNNGPELVNSGEIRHRLEPNLSFIPSLSSNNCRYQSSDGIVCPVVNVGSGMKVSAHLTYIFPRNMCDEEIHSSVEVLSPVNDPLPENNLVEASHSMICNAKGDDSTQHSEHFAVEEEIISKQDVLQEEEQYLDLLPVISENVSLFQERVCRRVRNRFTGNAMLLKRVNSRLRQRFSFLCTT